MIARLFAAAAVVWAAALPAAAYAASQPTGSGWQALGVAMYAFGGAICHQRPERSFALFGAQLPVCARCLGIYVGAATMAMAAVMAAIPPAVAGFGRDRVRLLFALGALPAALSLVYEWTTGDVPSNGVRAATGFALGAVVMLAILAAARNQVN